MGRGFNKEMKTLHFSMAELVLFRYFHGDLILNSYDGYGTDAVVYLKALTHEANELLPVFNKTSTKQYKTAVPTADWTDPSYCVSRGNTRGSR